MIKTYNFIINNQLITVVSDTVERAQELAELQIKELEKEE